MGGCRDMFVSCTLVFLAGAAWCHFHQSGGSQDIPKLGHHSSRVAPNWLCSHRSHVHPNSPQHGMSRAPGSPKLPYLHHKAGEKP